MRLDPSAFNAHLANMGQRFLWRPANTCPCVSEATGSPKQDCPVCEGKGRWWDDPIFATAAACGQKIQREWAQFGMWESGDVVLTIPSDSPLYQVGVWDQVAMADSTQPFNVTLTHGGADFVSIPVLEVNRAYWLNDAGDTVVEGGVPEVRTDGMIIFNAGPPPIGKRYIMTGRMHPTFYAFTDFAQDRSAHSGADLPRRVVLRKLDLYGRT